MSEFKDDDVMFESNKQNKKLSNAEISYIVAIVVLAVIVIVVVPTLSVLLIQKNNGINISSQNAPLLLNPKPQTVFSSQPPPLLKSKKDLTKIFQAGVPYTIAADDRLIVKVNRSATYFTSYFTYRYPAGTYPDLTSLVDALNTANNSEAIYYDTINFTWFVNSSLYWSISSGGKLQLTWQDPFYDQITFFNVAPIQDPNFNFSKGQGGIDDSTVPPNVSNLVTDFGIPVGTIINRGVPVILPFP